MFHEVSRREALLDAGGGAADQLTLKIPGTNEMGNTYKNLDHKNKNTVTQISFKSSILCIAGMTLNDK